MRSDRIWRSQGAGFWGTRGPVSRELDARNSCKSREPATDQLLGRVVCENSKFRKLTWPGFGMIVINQLFYQAARSCSGGLTRRLTLTALVGSVKPLTFGTNEKGLSIVSV